MRQARSQPPAVQQARSQTPAMQQARDDPPAVQQARADPPAVQQGRPLQWHWQTLRSPRGAAAKAPWPALPIPAAALRMVSH